jgi:hypothetical protein
MDNEPIESPEAGVAQEGNTFTIMIQYDLDTLSLNVGMSRPVDPVTLYGVLQSAIFEAFKMTENQRAMRAKGVTPSGIVLPGHGAPPPTGANVRL